MQYPEVVCERTAEFHLASVAENLPTFKNNGFYSIQQAADGPDETLAFLAWFCVSFSFFAISLNGIRCVLCALTGWIKFSKRIYRLNTREIVPVKARVLFPFKRLNSDTIVDCGDRPIRTTEGRCVCSGSENYITQGLITF